MIEGLEIIEGPIQIDRGGHLSLPDGFNKEKYAARWQFEGNRAARDTQPETITAARVRAQGWQIWKDPNSKPKDQPVTRKLERGTVVLMYRPKALQQAVVKAYAQISNDRVSDEVSGNTALGGASENGILTAQQMPKSDLEQGSELHTGAFPSAGFGDVNRAGQIEV